MGVPVGTPLLSSSGNVAAGVATATLPASSGRVNYLSGFDVTAGGSTAGAVVNGTVAGLLGGTRTFVFSSAIGATVGSTPLVMLFDPPLQASGPNVAIVVSVPSLGAGNTNTCVNAQGYQTPPV